MKRVPLRNFIYYCEKHIMHQVIGDTQWYKRYPVVQEIPSGTRDTQWYKRYPVVQEIPSGTRDTHWYKRYPVVQEIPSGTRDIIFKQQKYLLLTDGTFIVHYSHNIYCISSMNNLHVTLSKPGTRLYHIVMLII